MRILVLGGTRFFGKQLVKELIKDEHDITVATRGIASDDFGDAIKRLKLDRQDATSIKEVLSDKVYDVVYDNICYAPDDVSILLDCIKDNSRKYIVTSSLAVYDRGYDLKENAFDPYHYNIVCGTREAFTYAEGKRQVEAVCFQKYKDIKVTAVRFPVVIGKNDYTNRLRFYIDHIQEGKKFNCPGKDEKMSFITEEEAGKCLALLAQADYDGPINGNSHGTISVQEIIEIIEEATGRQALIDKGSEIVGPYSHFGGVTINNQQICNLGMRFEDVKKHLKNIIQQEVSILVSDKEV